MPNPVLFQTIAARLGATWLGTREHGYALCHQFMGTTQEPFTPPARPRRKTRTARRVPDAFLASYAWRKLRMEVVKARGARCECCGRTPRQHGIAINVDHIRPRKTHPELALDRTNLQVLCDECNHGKGNWDTTDWRVEAPAAAFAPCWTPPGRVQ